MRMQRHFRFHTARIRRRPVGRRIQKLSDHKKRWLSNLEEEEEKYLLCLARPTPIRLRCAEFNAFEWGGPSTSARRLETHERIPAVKTNVEE